MSKHTPGNWIIDEVEADLVEITAENRFGQVEIATVQLGYTGKIGDEQRANARLIAAAPEMLDMLTEAHNQIEYLSEKFGETGTSNTMCARIRHLIAKAEGRS